MTRNRDLDLMKDNFLETSSFKVPVFILESNRRGKRERDISEKPPE